MKKALAALIALALPAAALAEGASGFYVQADAAHAKASSSLGSAKGFSPRISAGYRINDLRFAVDYTRYKNYKQAPSTDFKLYSIGASVIYDFDTQSPVKPYFGARLGGSDSFSKTSAGLGVLAGVSYAVTPNVDLDAGYRYNYIGKVNTVKNVRSGELSAGVRVKF
ncbi:TPA: outer membrane beta-barrel protein NspA [Neisseria gonorrhoeae]